MIQRVQDSAVKEVIVITQNQIAYLKAKEEAKLNAAKTNEQELKNKMRSLANAEELWFRYGNEEAGRELDRAGGSSKTWRYLEGISDNLNTIMSPFNTFIRGKESDQRRSRKELY